MIQNTFPYFHSLKNGQYEIFSPQFRENNGKLKYYCFFLMKFLARVLLLLLSRTFASFVELLIKLFSEL